MESFTCWSCHGNVDEGSLFCPTCSAVQQQLPKSPFALFGIPVSFNVDKEAIEQKYLTLQKQLHPDNFVTKSKSEQMCALTQGSYLNDAYNILMNNIKLSVQILELNGMNDILHQRPSMEMMQEQFELRETLEEQNSLENLKQEVATKLKTCYKNLAEFFEAENYEEAAEKTIELQFLTKFEKDVKRKLRQQAS